MKKNELTYCEYAKDDCQARISNQDLQQELSKSNDRVKELEARNEFLDIDNNKGRNITSRKKRRIKRARFCMGRLSPQTKLQRGRYEPREKTVN